MIASPNNNFIWNISDKAKVKIEDTLKEFYKNNFTKGLNYEFENSENVKKIFLTGILQDEEKIPQLPLPYIINSFSNTKLFFIDIRNIMKSKLPHETEEIKPYIRDYTMFDIINMYTDLTAYHLNENIPSDTLTHIGKVMVNVFSNIISGDLRLNQYDAESLKIVLGYHFASMMFPESSKDVLEVLTAKMTVGIKESKEVVETLVNVKTPTETFNELSLIFKELPKSGRITRLTAPAISTIISNSIMGLGLKNLLVASLDDPLIFISLLKTTSNVNVYKKTKLVFTAKSQEKWLELRDLYASINTFIVS